MTSSQAIQTLKAEIISPDWSLSPKRIANCKDAMISLNLYFSDRRYAKGLVAISRHILSHLEENNSKNTNAVDLLKETMAHIVTRFENDVDELEDKKICSRCLKQFQTLGITVKKSSTQKTPFAATVAILTKETEALQSAAPSYPNLSATKQIEVMLTLQSIIAETKALQNNLKNEV